jgi:hypothetical protein
MRFGAVRDITEVETVAASSEERPGLVVCMDSSACPASLELHRMSAASRRTRTPRRGSNR